MRQRAPSSNTLVCWLARWGSLWLLLSQIVLIGFRRDALASLHVNSYDASSPDDNSALTVYNPKDADLKPSLSACLKKRKLGTCLTQEMASSPDNPGSPGINPTWVDFLGSFVGLRPGQLQNGEWIDSVGANFSIDRLDPDEVLADPNKIATDRKLGGQRVWVRHFLEIIPPFGYQRGNAEDWFAGGAFSFHGSIHIVRRHPMDQVYNNSLMGVTRSEIKILEQLAPTYLKIPYKLEGSGFLPGEGMEIERFGAFELAAGSAGTMIADPASWFAQAGVFGSIGPAVAITEGHFRTLMEVQTDNTIRVVLEKISDTTEKIQTQVDYGFSASIISILNSLINLEAGLTQEHKTVYDMNFDTKYEAAAHALRLAYLGRFGAALQLARQADTNYQGVRLQDISNVKEHSKQGSVQFFTFNESSKLAHDQVSTQSVTEGDKVTDTTLDYSVQKRSTTRSKRDLEINLENTTGDSLYLKYRFKSNEAKPEEIREFADLARVLGPADQSPDVSGYEATLSGKNKLDGFFYLALDAQAFSGVLEAVKSGSVPTAWLNAWAESLALPQAAQFAELTDTEQETASATVPGGTEHLRHFRNFVTALQSTLSEPASDQTGSAFVKVFRGEGTDLYPLAALASILDRNHTLALEQVTIKHDGEKTATAPSFMQFEEIGAQYVIPPKY